MLGVVPIGKRSRMDTTA